MDSSKDFYEKLPGFSNFLEITASRHYAVVPADWHVVLTDVKGSTQAIEEGRYKDVNTIGAASISVVMENLKKQVPFVFGGDGATLLVHGDDLKQVLEVLGRLQRLAEAQFGFILRVGQIPVGDILGSGGRVEVAKFELVAGRAVALFRGGGLTEAERRIKQNTLEVRPPEPTLADSNSDTNVEVELKGLSCRWNPLKSSRGRIMSLLVQARKNPEQVYTRFLAKFNEVYGGRPEEANPVRSEGLQYKSMAECARDETRFHSKKSTLDWLKRMFEIMFAVLVFKYRLPAVLFDSLRYLRSLPTHSDHRKFDDMIRMVIDCTPDQVARIQDYLEEQRLNGELFYGLHLSTEALMTCYVQEVEEGGHIHFIDGGNGGYAMAAKQLKSQMLGQPDLPRQEKVHCRPDLHSAG